MDIFRAKDYEEVKLPEFEYDSNNIEELVSKLDSRSYQKNKVVVDMANVRYINSTSLGMFLYFTKQFKEENKKLCLVNLQEQPIELLDMINVRLFLNVYGTIDDFVRHECN